MIEGAIYIAMFLVAILLVVRLWDKATMAREQDRQEQDFVYWEKPPRKNDAKKTRQGRR